MGFDEDHWEIVGSEIHFYSSVIGIPICLYLFILLLQVCFSEKYKKKKREREKERRIRNHYQSDHDELASSIATILDIEMTDMVNNDNHSEIEDTEERERITDITTINDTELIPGIPSKYCQFCTLLYCDIGEYILISSGIINIIFTVCKFIAVIIRQFPINHSQNCLIRLVHFCNQSKNIATMSFFVFMLYRIRIVFRAPQSVILSKRYYIGYLVSIQMNFLLKTIGAAITNYKYKILSDNNLCIYYSTKIGEQISNISFWFDSILLLLFITHFLKRCLLLSNQNRNINIFKIRVAILGLLACISSFSISSLAFTVFGNRYFIPIDMIIKTICLSATYKLKYDFGIININNNKYNNKQNNMMQMHSNATVLSSPSNVSIAGDEYTTKYSMDDEIFWSQYMNSQK